MVNIPIPFINRSRDPPLTDRERIENFLIEVGDRYKSHFSFTDLNDLFKWGRRTWKEKTDLEVVNSKLGHDLDRVNGEASRLGHQLKKTQEQLEQAVVRISYLDEDTKKLKLEREEAKKRWEQQTEQERRAHRAEMHSKMAAYERKIGDLKADIMINQKDSKAWTDEKLKKWLNDLRLRVQDIAPNWLTIDEQSGVPARLDPTGFIARAGRHEYPFLVRSTIWAVLLEHFFAVPFGFGALGPQGRRPLFEAYRAWRTFFDAGIDQEGEASFTTVFSADEDANRWRSATFESMYASIMDDEHHHHGEGLTLLRELYDANIQEAVRRIAAIMADATGGAPLKPKDMSQLEKTVTLAAQLGLQFGVHTGKLELTCPQQRAVVVISKEFNDHRDGAIHRGSSVRVDIVPEPGLNRLGNGTGDVDERVPLLPCMIVTLSS